jgi:hypothetical protein
MANGYLANPDFAGLQAQIVLIIVSKAAVAVVLFD